MKQWMAKNKNDEIISETDSNWEDVKNDITELYLYNNGQVIKLPPNQTYTQFKSASAALCSNSVEIESRVIGFVLGNNTVNIRLDEKTNNISVEIGKAP